MEKLVDASPGAPISHTFIPFYDMVLDEKSKADLGEVEVGLDVQKKVQKQRLDKTFHKGTAEQQEQQNLIDSIPSMSDPSEFLNNYQISNIIGFLPSLIKARPWNLLYSLNRDGVATST